MALRLFNQGKNVSGRRILSLLVLLGALATPCRADQIRERLYVATDKGSYLSGEQIQLKLITTDPQGRPVTFSKVGYVELLDSLNVRARAKIQIEEGIGLGHMTIPSHTPSGYYHLTGYTRYMQGEGEKIFFRTVLTVVNTMEGGQILESTEYPEEGDGSAGPSWTNVGGLSLSLSRDRLPARSLEKLHLSGIPGNVSSLLLSVTGEEFPLDSRAVASARDWKEGLSGSSSLEVSTDVRAEYEGEIIEARLVNARTSEPVRKGIRSYVGLGGENVNVYAGQQQPTDLSRVLFHTRGSSGSRELATVLVDLAGDSGLRLDLVSPYATQHPGALPPISLPQSSVSLAQKRGTALQLSQAFPQTRLRLKDFESALSGISPTETYVLDEYTRFNTIGETIFEFVTQVSFVGSKGDHRMKVLLSDLTNLTVSLADPLVVLDGIPVVDQELIYNYNPMFIKQIDVYRKRISISGRMFEGMVAFHTTSGNYPSMTFPETTQIFDYQTPELPSLLEEPDYGGSGKESRRPDFRHTLVWRPDVRTGGKSEMDLEFYTSDMSGSYRVRIQGLTEDGEVLDCSTVMRVE